MSTTHVMIESQWSDARWAGDVELPDGSDQLEAIFRFFNRVEDFDNERLLAVGYTLPSLSTGDHVTLNGQRWRCAFAGWELAS